MFRLFLSSALVALAANGAGLPKIPVYFEPNRGQAHPNVEFLVRGADANAYLLDREAILRVGGVPLRMRLLGARQARPEPLDALPGVSSYFTGADPSQWRTGIPQFSRIRYRGVYPGIDLVYYGAGSHMEYDFIVAPGADPAHIRLRYSGATSLSVDAGGDLRIRTADGEVRQHRPHVYQQEAAQGPRREIAASYRIHAGERVSLKLGSYDTRRALVIDPVLDYGTYFGGGAYEQVNSLKVDSEGNVYLAGNAGSPSTDSNPWSTSPTSLQQAVVIKFSPARNAVLYYVRLGGGTSDSARGIAVDGAGNAYVAGRTSSSSFPVINALQPSRRTSGKAYTGFVAKIPPDGKGLTYSTYLGGSTLDDILSIALDGTGAAYVTGNTSSADFPTVNAIQSKMPGPNATVAFLTKLAADGASMAYSTLYGGSQYNSAWKVVVDASNGAYIAGATSSPDFPLRNSPAFVRGTMDAFAVRFAPDGQSVVYSVLLGGGSGSTVAHAAALDGTSGLYIAGGTSSPYLPPINAIQFSYAASGSAPNAFIAKLGPNGMPLLCTYLGGSTADTIEDLAVDSWGTVYAAGWTRSSNFPTVQTLRAHNPGGLDGADAFVLRFAPGGKSLLYSTLIGGSGDDYAYAVAIDPAGAAYTGGLTTSTDFPLSAPYQSQSGGNTDMFLVRLSPELSLSVAPKVALSPSLVAFSTATGSTAPAPQTVQVSGNAGGAPGFTLSTSSFDNGSWLTAAPAGTSSFSVVANTAVLQPGRFSGTVRVAPTDGSTPVDLPVNVTVLSPAPALTFLDTQTLQLMASDALITIYGSGFDRSAVASAAVLNSSQYPLATTFVTAGILRAVIPGSLLTQPASFTITVTNFGSAVSNSLSINAGRPGTQVAPDMIYGPAGPSQTIAPGETLTIYGANIGPAAPSLFTLSDAGTVGTKLAGTRVLFDGVAAPVLFASTTQVSTVAPFGLAGKTNVNLQVEYQGLVSNSVPLIVAPAVPGIYTSDAFGAGQGSIINADGKKNSAGHPAVAGSVIAIYASGGGLFSTPVDDGAVLHTNVTLRQAVSVTIDGQPAETLYAGSAPGMVAGILQINARVPAAARSGAVPIVVKVGDASSQDSATVNVQ